MSNVLQLADLRVSGDEPRVLDVRLGERLGYNRPRAIRQLIEANCVELERYGAMIRGAVAPPGGGTSYVEYELNEGQALIVCMRSDAPHAPDVRQELVNVFQAYRRGRMLPAALQGVLEEVLAPILERAITPIREDIGKIVTFIGNKRLTVPVDVERDVYGCCLRFYSGLCGNCSEVRVVDDAGNKIKPGQLEHWGGRHDHRRENLWITCEACNRRLETEEGYRASRHPKFYAFQLDLKRYCADVRAPQQASLLLPLPGLPKPTPPVPALLLPDELTRAERICSAIYFTHGNGASIAEIGACGIATEGTDALASVRNGILRQLEGSTEHAKPPWSAKETLFRLADPTMKGRLGVRYSCTEMGIEVAKRVGPLFRSADQVEVNQ